MTFGAAGDTGRGMHKGQTMEETRARSDSDRRLIELTQAKWKIVFEERDRISRYVVFVNSGGILACITIATALLKDGSSPVDTKVSLILFCVGLFFAGFAMFSAFASMRKSAVHFREASKDVLRGSRTIDDLVNEEIRATMWPPSEILVVFSFTFFIAGLVVGLYNLYGT